MEPSAKTFHDSDRREPPNSRGTDVLILNKYYKTGTLTDWHNAPSELIQILQNRNPDGLAQSSFVIGSNKKLIY